MKNMDIQKISHNFWKVSVHEDKRQRVVDALSELPYIDDVRCWEHAKTAINVRLSVLADDGDCLEAHDIIKRIAEAEDE